MERCQGFRRSPAHILHTRRAGWHTAERRDRSVRRQRSTQRRRWSSCGRRSRCGCSRACRCGCAATTSSIRPQPTRPTGSRLADWLAAGRHVAAHTRGDRASMCVRQRPREPAPAVDLLRLGMERPSPTADNHPRDHQFISLLVQHTPDEPHAHTALGRRR